MELIHIKKEFEFRHAYRVTSFDKRAFANAAACLMETAFDSLAKKDLILDDFRIGNFTIFDHPIDGVSYGILMEYSGKEAK